MITFKDKKKIWEKLFKIEEHIDSFQESLNTYKNSIAVLEPIDILPITEVKTLTPTDLPLSDDFQEESQETKSENSLFDNLIQDYIRDKNFSIETDSDDDIGFGIIMENTRDPIIEMALSGNIIQTNPSFNKLFNCTEKQLVNNSIYDLVPEEYHKGIREGIDDAINKKFGNYHDNAENILVFRAQTQDGTIKSMEGPLLHLFKE